MEATAMRNELFSLFEILEQKNSYLLEFHKINMHELNRLAEGCIDNLENFYYSRELLLNAINKLDHKIPWNNLDKNLKANKVQKKKLMNILNLKHEMVMSILDQDLVILSLINKIKDGNLRAIAS